jgi:hypothetical protein
MLDRYKGPGFNGLDKVVLEGTYIELKRWVYVDLSG